MAYIIGLDYGTNSIRCLVVDSSNGNELAQTVWNYETGREGILLDESDHNLARQNPADYLKGTEITVRQALAVAREAEPAFSAEQVIGVGVDTTGSTPLPVDRQGRPLAFQEEFANNLNAQAWLWKDHTSHSEAAEITALAGAEHPEYLAKCGGTYSSEWFFSKILHCLRADPQVFEAAYTWYECADYIPAVMTGTVAPDRIKRGRCAAGHKAMFCSEWGGLPAKAFLTKLDGKLGQLRDRLYKRTYTIDQAAGYLAEEWARKTGLPAGIPVAVGAFDAHLGAVGSGVRQGVLVKIIGTSSCDILVSANSKALADIPGICGIVDGSVLPGSFGLEAGQSAVGDIFNWYVNYLQPGGKQVGSHEELTEKAARLKPGQSGLLALDWNNGNRTVLADQRLTGLLVGQTLHTRPEEIYRALIEATAFGSLMIINRFEEYGAKVDEIISCGGIAEKNPMLMQIYADITGREMKVSRSSQSSALGAALAGAVVAGSSAGGHDSFAEAQRAMCGVKAITYTPVPEERSAYERLFALYKQLHDAFGQTGYTGGLENVMKELLDIKDKAREGKS